MKKFKLYLSNFKKSLKILSKKLNKFSREHTFICRMLYCLILILIAFLYGSVLADLTDELLSYEITTGQLIGCVFIFTYLTMPPPFYTTYYDDVDDYLLQRIEDLELRQDLLELQHDALVDFYLDEND